MPVNLDIDATDDLTLSTIPAAGDITGSYAAGFTVDNVDYTNISNLPANLDTDATDDFDGDFTSLSNVPVNLDIDATDDLALGTIPAAGDISGSYAAGFTVENVDYANISNLPINLDVDATDDIALGTVPATGDISGSYIVGFTVDNVDFDNITNLPVNLDLDASDDFDGDYNSLTNQPSIPTSTSDLINDSGFLTSEGDPSPTNENQTVSAGTGITVNQVGQDFEVVNDAPDQTVGLTPGSGNVSITGTYPNFVVDVPSVADGDADDTNELQDISTDDTAGNISLSDGSTLTLNVDDADASPTNENQTVSAGTGITVNQVGQDFEVVNDAPDQTVGLTPGSGNVSITGTYPNFVVDVPSVADGDADDTNELQDISTDDTAGNISLSDGSTLTLNVDDADASPTNENQTVSAGTGIVVNQVGQDFEVVNDAPDQTVGLTPGSGNVSITGTYPNFVVDVPSVADGDADDTNELQDISTDDTAGNISLSDGSTLTLNVDDADASPTNENQTVSAGTGITVNQVGQDFEVVNDAPDQTVGLTPGSGNVSITGTYPNFVVDVPSVADGDADDTNELQDISTDDTAGNISLSDGSTLTLNVDDADASPTNENQTVSAGTGITVNQVGQDFEVVNDAPDQTVGLTPGSGNVSITGTYPNFVVDVPSVADGDADDTNELQDISTDDTAGNISLSDGSTLTLNVDDADASPTNENQTVSAGTGITVNQVGQDFEVVNDAPDQTVGLTPGSGNVSITGTYPNFVVDVPSVADGDADDTNELQDISTDDTAGNISLSDGSTLTLNVDDADASPTNENQTVSAGTGIVVNQVGQDFEVVNDAPDQTVGLTPGSGNVSITGTYPNFVVDVPSVADGDADDTNELQDISTDDTAGNISLSDGSTLTLNVDDADASPTNENQTVSAGTGITVNQVGQDFEVVNDAPDQTVGLTPGSGNVSITGTYPNFVVDVPSVADGDADDTNELQDISTDDTAGNISLSDGSTLTLNVDDADASPTNENQTVSAGTGITVNQVGQDFEVVNDAPDQTVGLTPGSGNVSITGTYPNFVVDVPSVADGDADDTNELQDISTDDTAGNISLSDGSTLTLNVDDADASPTNENQTVSAGTGIVVNQVGQDFEVVNDAPDQTVGLNPGSGNVSITGTYPNFVVDVPSVADGDADDTNELQDISTDDTAGNISLSDGSTLTLNVDDADASPTNENQTVSAGTGITVNQVGQDFEVVNDAPDQTVGLTPGSGNVSITGTYPNFTVDVPSLGDYNSLSNLPALGDLAPLDEVSTSEITDGTITSDDLNSSIAGDGLTGGAGSPLAISLAASSGLQISGGGLAALKGPATTVYGNGVGNVIHTINTDDFGRITSVVSSALISDRRLKDDIAKLDDSLDKTLTLNGYSYYLKSDSLKLDRHYGVMAQEVEKVFPELIIQRSDGFMSVDYDGLIPVLLEAIKAQSKKIENLEKSLSEQTQKVNVYETRILNIESNLQNLLNLLNNE